MRLVKSFVLVLLALAVFAMPDTAFAQRQRYPVKDGIEQSPDVLFQQAINQLLPYKLVVWVKQGDGEGHARLYIQGENAFGHDRVTWDCYDFNGDGSIDEVERADYLYKYSDKRTEPYRYGVESMAVYRGRQAFYRSYRSPRYNGVTNELQDDWMWIQEVYTIPDGEGKPYGQWRVKLVWNCPSIDMFRLADQLLAQTKNKRLITEAQAREIDKVFQTRVIDFPQDLRDGIITR